MADCVYPKDCITFPIRKKCVQFCLFYVLKTATIEENQLILGIDQDLAMTIHNIFNGPVQIDSFADLSTGLSPEQVSAMILRFEQLNQFQLHYFARDKAERDLVIEAIRNMRLDSDNEPLFAGVS